MTAFDNDRWEAERKARLERVGHRETEMTDTLERAARAVAKYQPSKDWGWGSMHQEEKDRCFDIARAVLMAVLASVGPDMDCPYFDDAPIGPVLRSILAEPQP